MGIFSFTATTSEINTALDGVTATAAELNYLDIASLGTGAASKAVVLDSGDDYTWPATGVLTYGVLNDGSDAIAATAAEINRAADLSARLVSGGASLTLTAAAHDGKIIALDAASGTAITLPAATGTGAKFTLIVTATVTSNTSTIACAGTDEFHGVVYQVDTDTSDTVAAYPALAADNFDVITMDGTTTGGLSGDRYEVVDIASGVWSLQGWQNASGTVATPLSAT
ncbi:MAG: hypothetical protein ACYTHJ_21465 [Planctomycetota bacterium]